MALPDSQPGMAIISSTRVTRLGVFSAPEPRPVPFQATEAEVLSRSVRWSAVVVKVAGLASPLPRMVAAGASLGVGVVVTGIYGLLMVGAGGGGTFLDRAADFLGGGVGVGVGAAEGRGAPRFWGRSGGGGRGGGERGRGPPFP